MEWKQIIPDDYKGSGNVFYRCYVRGETEYPRIVISFHKLPFEGIIISVNQKNKKDEWWEQCPLPFSLVFALKEMIDLQLKEDIWESIHKGEGEIINERLYSRSL